METASPNERIVDPQKVLRIDSQSAFIGIPVEASASLEVARNRLAAARVPTRLPEGNYHRVAEDSEVALYQPVRYNIIWNPHTRWACYKVDLRRRYDIYSQALPIIVGDQSGSRLSAHHGAPAHNARLWCYMRQQKFAAMIENGGILLTRSDLFPDKSEGTLRPANLHLRQRVYASDAMMRDAGVLSFQEFARMKRWTYVNCWRQDSGESERCWREYVGNQAGVALVTTYGKLARFAATLFCASVEYEEEAWIPEGNTYYPFIYKREEWRWEREFRLIVQRFPIADNRLRSPDAYDCSQINPCTHFLHRVDLRAILSQIVVGPNTREVERAELRELIQEVGLEPLVIG